MKHKIQLTNYYNDDPKWWQNLCQSIKDPEDARVTGDFTRRVNQVLKPYNAEYVFITKNIRRDFDNYVVFNTEEELIMCVLAYS